MKKALSVLFSLTLIFSFGTSAFADSQDKKLDKIYELIEKTNNKIEKKIEDGVAAADKLKAKYLEDVRKLKLKSKVAGLESQKQASFAATGVNDTARTAQIDVQIQEATAKVDQEIHGLEQEIDQATAQLITPDDKDGSAVSQRIGALESKLNQGSDRYEELTRRYTEKLNKIITDVYDETYKLASYAIDKAAEQGIVVERYWKLVKFADREVWIDPVWVVGIN
ncbi:hypothetical protein [Paenibacillus sp. J22TS3]|uniref:hypothetical protein n=1 Tax=Paenibacillus sp. J22TS3 TaxID=2807192 RepID=UPI001B0FB81D|nr:hypothetical protein [Paenibacillus sp. J22TS3]GIP22099.1 hypothetical protein J22TS3_23740 [Paenibacillus sp. J22TS3]